MEDDSALQRGLENLTTAINVLVDYSRRTVTAQAPAQAQPREDMVTLPQAPRPQLQQAEAPGPISQGTEPIPSTSTGRRGQRRPLLSQGRSCSDDDSENVSNQPSVTLPSRFQRKKRRITPKKTSTRKAASTKASNKTIYAFSIPEGVEENEFVAAPTQAEKVQMVKRGQIAFGSFHRGMSAIELDEEIRSCFSNTFETDDFEYTYMKVVPGSKGYVKAKMTRSVQWTGEALLNFINQGQIYFYTESELLNKETSDSDDDDLEIGLIERLRQQRQEQAQQRPVRGQLQRSSATVPLAQLPDLPNSNVTNQERQRECSPQNSTSRVSRGRQQESVPQDSQLQTNQDQQRQSLPESIYNSRTENINVHYESNSLPTPPRVESTVTCRSQTEQDRGDSDEHRSIPDDSFMVPSDSGTPTVSFGSTIRDESATEILVRLQSTTTSEGLKNKVNVVRNNVLDGGFRGFTRSTFLERHQLCVKFAGEQGMDEGGLTREFMRLALQEIQAHVIFEGPENKKTLSLDTKAHSKGDYRVIGRMIAYILVHGGPAPHFFSDILYNMLTAPEEILVSLMDVHDVELQGKLRKLQDCSDQTEYEVVVNGIEDLINIAGCMPFALKVGDKEALVHGLCRFLCIDRKMGVLSQFCEGLQTLGVLQEIKTHKEAMKPLFVDTCTSLTAELIEGLFDVQWSEVGSNRYNKEARTISYWGDFLQDLQDDGNLNILLEFATGLSRVPPLGLSPTPQLTFGHPEDFDSNDPTIGFPRANTCGHILRIPLCDDYNSFKEIMLAAITQVTFFTTE